MLRPLSNNSPAKPARGHATPLLDASNLAVRYGSFKALTDVSLRVGRRGVHAVIGPNGAGKTTLFNVLSGHVKPSEGVLSFESNVVNGFAADRLARLGVGRSFQICSVFPNLSVAENIKMATMRGCGILRMLQRSGAAAYSNVDTNRLLEQTGLWSNRHRPASELSYGRRRLLEIVTALAPRPKLLLLDEPMAGLAREDIPPVVELISETAKTCSVVLIEHNLKVVEALADQVTVIAEGSVLCHGSYVEVSSDARVIKAYIGTAE
ncbi:ABC transporter ATP-binding protein [Burkholderia diffusa]|uniref:ABC transporter ATP-binding protein n=1 Tax=Burkholderia diffusa TaxID=488732 RepID=UPI002ABE8A9C|nr:ABC transporter ATP-binding protein [Burkholderia diffusa]